MIKASMSTLIINLIKVLKKIENKGHKKKIRKI